MGKESKVNYQEHYVTAKIREQREEQLLAEKQKNDFLEKSEKVFKENGIEQELLEYVKLSRIQNWLRYSEDSSFKEIVTSSGRNKLKKIRYTPPQIIYSDNSIAVSFVCGKHWHIQDVPSINEIKIHQNEDGEFTVSGYNHEYTVDGYSKDTRFKEVTSSNKLKGKSLVIKISSLMNEAILAVSGPKNKTI